MAAAQPNGLVVKVKSNKKEEVTTRSFDDENSGSASNSCSIMSQEDENKEMEMVYEQA